VPLNAFLPDFADLSGTGSFVSYLPGTGPGDLGRKIKNVGQLNDLIRQYNERGRFQFKTCTGGGRTFPCDAQGTELGALAELPTDTRLGGDSIISQDLRLSKAFNFTESSKLELIGEVFNLFNVANLGTTQAGIVTQILPAAGTSASDIQTYRPTGRSTNVFGTGGPRAFQFAARFTF